MTADRTTRPAAPRTRLAADGAAGEPVDTQVAAALRSAYEEAMKEDVPAEFLDLLGKLS